MQNVKVNMENVKVNMERTSVNTPGPEPISGILNDNGGIVLAPDERQKAADMWNRRTGK